MVNRKLILCICLTAIVLLNARSAKAQQSKPLPANPVIANPIDPASLNAPPAFGDSAPVEKKPVELPALKSEPSESSEVAVTIWKPKLRVVLLTKSGTLDKPLPNHRPEEFPTFLTPDGVVPLPNTAKRTSNKMTAPGQPFATLMCDEVTVEAKASETGELAYSVSCKGKAILEIDDYTVTGDSISSDDGKLTITNAVVKSEKATLTAEKMQIQLPILGVRVEPNSAEPNSAAPNGSRDSFEQDPEVTVPFERGPEAIVPLPFSSSARLETYDTTRGQK